MVHVSKCPCKRRATPTIEFYKDGKPQIYCFGWRNYATDEPIAECKNCADWVFGEQCEKDFTEWKSKIEGL